MSPLPPFLEKDLEWRRLLGEGSFGVVHEVLRRADGARLALKLLPVQGSGERERREIMAALTVSHPRVIRCEGAGSEAGVAWLLLELAEGSLEPRIGDASRVPETWGHLRQACAGVRALHRVDLVHRDLKPSNILLTGEGAKVSDLGLTKGGDLRTVTKAGLVLGTPGYLAPEQARGEKLTPAADVFAMGVMFYQLVEGRLPYPDDTAVGLIQRVARGEVYGFERGRSLPREVRALLEAMLEADPGRRPGDIEAAADELGPFRFDLGDAAPGRVAGAGTARTLLSGQQLHPVRVGAAPPGEPGARAGRRKAMVGGGLLVLLLVLGGLLRGPAAPAELRWHTIGDAVVVEFRGGDPASLRLVLDGVAQEDPGAEAPPNRRLARRLRPQREVMARLAWSGGESEAVPLTPGFPAVSRRIRPGPGHRLRVEVRRACPVGFEGAGEPGLLQPGVHQLEPPAAPLPWTLGWTEEGIEFRQELTAEDLVADAVERLDRSLGDLAVRQVVQERFMSRMIRASMRSVDRDFWGEDPVAPERAVWHELDGWLPTLLGAPTRQAGRRRLFELWRDWSVYEHLNRDLVGEQPVLWVPPGAVGALAQGLPDWPGARRVSLAAPLPVTVRAKVASNFMSMLSERTQPSGEVVARLELTWPALEVPDQRRVALCLRGSVRRWFQFRLSSLEEGGFHLFLRRDDHTIPRLEERTRGLPRHEAEDLHKRAWQDPEAIWIAAVLPGDLWPPAGTRLALEFEALISEWPATGTVEELQILVEGG